MIWKCLNWTQFVSKEVFKASTLKIIVFSSLEYNKFGKILKLLTQPIMDILRMLNVPNENLISKMDD